MGALYSLLFGKREERQRVGIGTGIVNALKNSWRGLVASILAITIFGALFEPVAKSRNILLAIWLIMGVFFLLEPMPTSASALLPLFSLPMLGVMSSANVCKALINENIVLFFLGGWLLLLFNNCGLDKRLICSIMAQGNSNAFTPMRLLIKSCVAAFASSAFAERELASQALMGYLVSALGPLKLIKAEGDYDKFKNILCMSVAVSSLIGSMCFLHASLTTLQLRSMFHTSIQQVLPMIGITITLEFPDVFNFTDYSTYAIPVAIIMLIFNTLYEAILVFRCTKKPSLLTQQTLQKSFKKNLQDLGPMTNHEKISIFFYVFYMACFFSRWSHNHQSGWASFSLQKSTNLPGVNDATVAAIFVVALHFLPKSLNFLKIWSVKRVGDLPQMKPESGLLFWKFVDKHTDYSLFLVFGAGSAIYQGCVVETTLFEKIGNTAGGLTELNWNVGILIVVMSSVLLGNLMTGMAAQACLMPFYLCLATKSAIWYTRLHLVALGVGLGTGLGFCLPHRHTPSFFVRSTGKVALKTQIIYSIASSIICGVVLWLSLCFFARFLWEDVTPIVPGLDVLQRPTVPTEPSVPPSPPERV